jgi:hypothetical protein
MRKCFLNNVTSGAVDNAVLNFLEKSIEVPSASKIHNRSTTKKIWHNRTRNVL